MNESDSNENDFSSSSDESDVSFFEDKIWNDIKPIYLTIEETQLVDISYTKRFEITYAYFRAILQKNEISERAFKLTKECISLNPANYNAWYYRRRCLIELEKNIYDEFKYLDSIILKNQKNYQIWQHRKCLVKYLKDPHLEKEFTKNVISNESKNYHAWQYRQWVISKFNLFDDELEFTENLIKEDVRNNSAWNHRFYVFTSLFGQNNNDQINSEIIFIIDNIKRAFENESSWNYLVGILGKKNICKNEIVNNFIEMFENKVTSPHFYSFKLDQLLLKLSEQTTINSNLADEALELANNLAENYDKIRNKYWCYIADNIRSNFMRI